MVYIYREKSMSTTGHCILIMWSNLFGWPDHTNLFTVNHFVPILPVQMSNENSDDGVTALDWNIIKRRIAKPQVVKKSKSHSQHTRVT